PQRLAGHGPQKADPARVVFRGGGVLLLLRPLLRGVVDRPVARGGPGVLPGPPGDGAVAVAVQGRLVVGLSAVQLPPAVRDGVCADDDEVLSPAGRGGSAGARVMCDSL